MADLNYLIDFTANTGEVTQAGREIERLTGTIQNIGAGQRGLADLNQIITAIEQAGGNATELRNRLTQLNNSFNSLSIQEQESQIRQLADSTLNMARATNNATQHTERLFGVRTSNTINSEITQINTALAQLRQRLANGTISQAEFNRMTTAGEQRLNALQAELNQTEQATDRLGNATAGVSKAFNGLTGLMGSLGVSVGAMELIQLADQFNNLEAKVKLATGGGEAFVTAMQGVQQVANDTFTDLETTATLFGKLSSSSKQLKLSQDELLGLTKTINQAMQVSGATAEESSSAILQLSQGLASGVLRGEEFGAVMESGGRLATAMAKGLNVTTNELRTMASEGKLTANTVIQAIQSQADVINTEFNSMPTTVDNAMQQLKNNILSFVGDIDNQLNQSSGLATFIQDIADNIKNIDPTTIESVKIAFEQLGTLAKELWTSFSQGSENLADLWSSFDGTATAGQKVGLLTKIVQELSLFIGHVADGTKALQITSDAVFGAMIIGIGGIVSAWEKLTGKTSEYSDTLMAKGDEMLSRAKTNAENFESSAEKASQAIQKSMAEGFEKTGEYAEKTAQKHIEAFEKISESSKSVSEIISQNGQITAEEMQKGLSAVADNAEEIKTKFKDAVANAITPEQVESMVAVLGKMAQEGKISGEELANAMNLAKPRIAELEQETGRAVKSLKDLGIEANQSIKDKLSTSVQDLGLDWDKTSTKTTESFNKMTKGILNLGGHFDELKNGGYDASLLIMQGLEKATDTAKNQAEIRLLKEVINQFGQEGKLSADQVATAMEAINEKVSKTPALMDETAKAFKALGIISKEQALQNAQEQMAQFELVKKSGQASNEQLAQALQKVQKSIETSGDTAQTSWLKGQQSALGLNKELDNTANKAERVVSSSSGIGDAISHSVRRGVDELDKLNQALDSTARRNQALTEQWEKDKAQREANNNNFLGAVNRDYSQYSTKTGVENFLKQAGLSNEQAMEETRKLFNQYGGNGKMNWAKANGFSEGMPMTTEDFKKYKSPSMYLLELAEKVRYSQKATASISIGNQSTSQKTDNAPSNPDNSQIQAMQAQIASLQQQLQAKNQTATTLPKIDTSQNQALAKSLVDDLLKQAIAQGGQAMLQQLQDEIKRLPR